jgi:hypothetical protein
MKLSSSATSSRTAAPVVTPATRRYIMSPVPPSVAVSSTQRPYRNFYEYTKPSSVVLIANNDLESVDDGTARKTVRVPRICSPRYCAMQYSLPRSFKDLYKTHHLTSPFNYGIFVNLIRSESSMNTVRYIIQTRKFLQKIE